MKKKSGIKLLPLLCYSLCTVLMTPEVGLANGDQSPTQHHAKHPTKHVTKHAPAKKAAPAKKKKAKAKKGKAKKAAKAKCPKKPIKRFFVWGTGSIGSGKDDFITARSRNDSYTGLIGMSYQVLPAVTVGFYYSNGYRKGRTHVTQFTQRGKNNSDSNNFFWNASYNFNPKAFINVVLGYTNTQSKSWRYAVRNPFITYSKSETNVFNASPSLNYAVDFTEAFKGSFQFGYSYSRSNRKAAIDSNGRFLPKHANNSNSANVFADFSYGFKDVTCWIKKLAPYINGGLNHGFEQQVQPNPGYRNQFISRRQDGWSAGTGLRFNFSNDISANAGWSVSGGRSKTLNNTVSVTIKAGIF